MTDRDGRTGAPGFVVLQCVADDDWRLLGEVRRTPGLTAQAARTKAILDVTGGAARAGEVYAAVLRSEWRVAQKWSAPGEEL